ncbi:MAG TPA: hypothetical protein VKX46_05075 [Ktedonobacteraceae bacterium]|nr:hypothetical protein [Ktedonobacteraceae bacterium]
MRDNFKTWKMGLPEDSLAYQDLLEYGRELGMQPAETARVIIVEWSQARRGRLSLGGGFLPQMVVPSQTVAPASTAPNGKPKEVEIDQAKARGKRFASSILDDDE